MRSIRDSVRENLLVNEIVFCETSPGVFEFKCFAQNCQVFVTIEVSEEEKTVRVSVFSGVTAPQHKLHEIYEFACLANLGLVLGAFWVTPESGRVALIVTTALADTEPSNAFIGTMICAGIQIYDRYYPALCRVLYAGVPAAEAVRQVEGPSDANVTDAVARLIDGKTGRDDNIPSKTGTDSPPCARKKTIRPGKAKPNAQAADSTAGGKDEDASAGKEDKPKAQHAVENIVGRVDPEDYDTTLREIRENLFGTGRDQKPETDGSGEAESA